MISFQRSGVVKCLKGQDPGIYELGYMKNVNPNTELILKIGFKTKRVLVIKRSPWWQKLINDL